MIVTTRVERARGWAMALAGGATVMALAAGMSPASGAVPRVPPATHKVSSVYDCNNSTTGAVKFAVSAAGATPGTVAPGSAVKMTGFQMIVTLPGSVATDLLKYGYRSLSGRASTLDVNSTDAKTKTVNAAKKPLTFPSVKLVKGQAIPIKFPASPATIGSWTPVSKGTMSFTMGNATITLTVPSLGSLTFTCTPSPAAKISTSAVS